MKTKSATEQPPLLLCEVLEEEFVQLHGKLPYAPSWEFKGAHFRTDASGTPRLLTTLKTREDELAKHLLDQVGLRSILSADELSAKLNALLQAPALNSIAQASQPASHATPLQKLLGLRSGVDSASLRRHAIEESFPDDIEPIHEIRLRQVYDAIHRLSEEAETGAAPYANRAALCLSGGGIRSATFGLGVLQALARRGVIGAFSFVSTVSGGGFVGSWFSAWIHRHPQGLDGVVRELALAQAPDAFTSKPKLEPEVPPIRHLRSYSNYLSPKLGFLSADAWTLGTIYLRNLLLNWLVIIPLLLALLALPRFLVMAMWLPANHALQTAALALGTVAAIAAIVYASVNRPGAHRHVRIREGSFWCFAQTQSGFLRLCLTPLLLAALCFQLHWIWFCASGRPPYAWWQFALFGTAVHSVGWLAGFLILARQENEPQSGKARRTAWVHEFIGVVVTGAAGGLLVGWGALKLFSPTLLIQPANELLFASFATPAFLALFLMAATLFVGAVSRWTSDEDREWWGRVGA
ncbi:MAG TPA: patatin-like phospholipase family protein, partial [Candidatus Limnocylindria bacterium]|nr:patatin-like phospholipase family protein [Candidatus Limnocylindria bacterium]